jgi:hypothetical protein
MTTATPFNTAPVYVVKVGNATVGGTRCHSLAAAEGYLAVVKRAHPKARIVSK